MFLYNLKLNGNRLIKFSFIIMLLIILIIFSVGIYKTYSQKTETTDEKTFTLSDAINTNKVFQITEKNYTNILQAVTNDIDSYIGTKIHFTGYIYRLLDFEDDEFVLARDMIIDDNNQSLVVGFLCKYKDAKKFADGTWVDITGKIIKGDYYGDIAIIEVEEIFECDEPENKYVDMPDKNYIPTVNLCY